jgi:predicted lipoprotein with Yx(FWY)xxD motif
VQTRLRGLAAIPAVLVAVAACSGGGATPGPTTLAATTPAATTPAATTPAATGAPSAAAGAATVNATAVGSAGTILVDGATGMTLYLFTKDVKDSGKSVCTGGCLETWPALTVAAGAAPTGGTGVDAAKLGTITREDNGALQVTYDGKPLYFFKNDKAPGDLNGVYENWETVAP